MITILGAGGAIGSELVTLLDPKRERVRLVGRRVHSVPGMEAVTADLAIASEARQAVTGSRVAILLAGLRYEVRAWSDLWPRIMRNAIDAARNEGVRLIFFDNVYMYGKVDGAMTEETPFRPCSRKGEIRARIAAMLLDEIKVGNLTALIARSADFYGPGARTGMPNLMVFDKLAHGTKALWMANDSVPHSFTYTPDAAKALLMLAESETAWNQTWHLPTCPDPPTGKQFMEMAAGAMKKQLRYRVLSPGMLRMAGWFDSTIRELHEMLYQYEYPYLFDSRKFTKALGFEATGYAEGIRQTASAVR